MASQWAKSPKSSLWSVLFLTTWHCILSDELTKTILLQTVFLAILPILPIRVLLKKMIINIMLHARKKLEKVIMT